ncbi:MAG TPA: glycosyltransferase family 39 protein [Candidatus Sumerlaeota bacterium]|nr:glycosyltransferase family 39 protein [Candidatus Sumerlaeota bacterium]
MNLNAIRYSPYFFPGMLAILFAGLEVLTAQTFGFHPDEYYYFACAYHPAFGYVDHPAFIAWITRISLLFGNSAYTLHLFPALAGVATLMVTAATCIKLGGGRFAAFLSVLSILTGMYYWVVFGFVSMNAYDILWITLAAYCALCILESPSLGRWLLLGLIIGIGANTKTTMFIFAVSLILGLLLSKERRLLKTLPPYFTILIALALSAPFLYWQFANGCPTLEFIRNVSSSKNLVVSPPQFLLQIVLATGVFTAPIWMTGIATLLRSSGAIPTRALGIGILLFFLIYLTNHSKFYYILPAFPFLFAAGSVAIEHGLEQRHNWIRVGLLLLLSSWIIVQLPLGVPLLPMEAFASYLQIMRLSRQMKTEDHPSAQAEHVKGIPDYFGQRIGAREFVATVARVYHSLPEPEKADCAIFGKTYAFAGMVDFFGPEFGLPKAISAHNNYWLWGPREYSGETLLVCDNSEKGYIQKFESVEILAEYEFPYREDNFRVLKILCCRHPKKPLADLWREIKTFD